MPAGKNENLEYQTLNAAKKNSAANAPDQATLKSSNNFKKESPLRTNLVNQHKKIEKKAEKETISPAPILPESKSFPTGNLVRAKEIIEPESEISYAAENKSRKVEKKREKDRKLLSEEHWLARNGHTLTYIALYLFSIQVFFRPYELFTDLSFLSKGALVLALITLILYVPTQLSTEGSLTIFSTEVKCVIALTLIALLTMPIAKDSSLAWTTFNDSFSKAVVMFIVMVNVVRTRRRLMGLIGLSLTIGIYLSFMAISLFMRGELKAEGYRVAVEVQGLFGNPNDMALHLVTITPLAFALAFATRNALMRFVYIGMAGLFVAATMFTFSRGGFLGLIASSAVLAWKLGRKNRLNISLAAIVGGGLFIVFAPGNYGARILSIFGLAPDPVGSSDQRKELLMRSLIVSARNPWGIGIGNFPIVSIHNLVTHNAFTQISSELGLLGLAAYLIFMISPFRKLGAIERTLFEKKQYDWFYYLSIGLQASIVGYMVSSFFVAVAYNWFVYYLIAYAVAFRRIYKIGQGIEEKETDVFGLQNV